MNESEKSLSTDVSVNAEGDAVVGGDVVGRDKITNVTHNYFAEQSTTSTNLQASTSKIAGEQQALLGSWSLIRSVGQGLTIQKWTAILHRLVFFKDGTLSAEVSLKGGGLFSFINSFVSHMECSGKYSFPEADTIRMELTGRNETTETFVCRFAIADKRLQLKTLKGDLVLYERSV